MLKKALLAGVLGIFLASGAAFAVGCNPGDTCQVSNPHKVEFGLDFKVDIDVCVDAGNLMGDYWSTQAGIYQAGEYNIAGISQSHHNQKAGIVQQGESNTGYIAQTKPNEYAFIYQGGESNFASISQSIEGAAAAIVQLGNGNVATITQ